MHICHILNSPSSETISLERSPFTCPKSGLSRGTTVLSHFCYSHTNAVLTLKLQCHTFVLPASVPVVLDVYTPTSILDNNTTLQLGTTCILICRTGGLPHGTDYNYTWTCPNGPCTIGQGLNTNRDTYGDRLLLNILSYSDAGTYTCQVRLATTGQLLGMDQFVLGVEGMCV